GEALVSEAASRRNLARLHVANGVRLMNEGDLFGSLSWFTEAYQLEQEDPERGELHRQRLAAVLRRCPKLVQLWTHESPVRRAELSPTGERLVVVGLDGTALIWSAATGASVPQRPLNQG